MPTHEPALALPDVNVLVALTNPSHQHHARAHRWLAEVTRFATTPITESGLVRLLLNPVVTGQRVTGEQAVGVLTALKADARATFVPDTSSLAAAQVDVIGLASYKQVTDFHLINLAAKHGAALATFDARIEQTLAPVDRKFVNTLR